MALLPEADDLIRGTAARRAGRGRAHRPFFRAIVSARATFASRVAHNGPRARTLARAARLRFDPNQIVTSSRFLPKLPP